MSAVRVIGAVALLAMLTAAAPLSGPGISALMSPPGVGGFPVGPPSATTGIVLLTGGTNLLTTNTDLSSQ